MGKDNKIQLNDIDTLVSKIKMHNSDEENLLVSIKTCLIDMAGFYKSSYALSLSNSNINFTRDFSALLENRRTYVRILQTTRNKYEGAAVQSVRIFENLESEVRNRK